MTKSGNHDELDEVLVSVVSVIEKLRLFIERRASDTLPEENPAQLCEYGNENILGFAKAIYAARRFRETILPPELFGEPGYDILLFTFIAREEGADVSISDVCDGSAGPSTTALRWIKKLEDMNYLIRGRVDQKSRRVSVSISDNANEAVRQYLERLVTLLRIAVD